MNVNLNISVFFILQLDFFQNHKNNSGVQNLFSPPIERRITCSHLRVCVRGKPLSVSSMLGPYFISLQFIFISLQVTHSRCCMVLYNTRGIKYNKKEKRNTFMVNTIQFNTNDLAKGFRNLNREHYVCR